MAADGSVYLPPVGKSPDQLLQSLRQLVATLNREKQAATTENSGLSEQIAALQALIDAAEQQIADILAILEDIELNGGLTDQQAFELALVTAVDEILGTPTHLVLDSIRRSQESSKAVIRALLEGKKNAIGIRVEQQARLTETEAFVRQFTEFSAQIGLSLGLVNNEIVARADGDSALASSVDTVTTALNGNIAQVALILESVDGIEQRFGVTLNSNGEVIGLLQLDGTPSGSTFTVLADNLYIGKTGTSGGTPVPIFAIRTIDGVPKIGLRADVYADGDIVARHLAAASVTAIKIAAGAIEADKIAAGAVVEAALANDAVTAGKIASSAVTEAKIGTAAVTTTKILDASIVTDKLGAFAVTAAKIAADAIEADKIAANAVTTAKLEAGAVTTAKLAAGAVTANEIAANAVTTAKLEAGAVTAAKLSVTSLSAIVANMGTITAGKIESTDGEFLIDCTNKEIRIET